MSGPPTKRPGSRLPSRKPGEISEPVKSYPLTAEVQAVAWAHAVAVTDLAERFLSALCLALAEGVRLPVGAAALEFQIDAMPTAATRNLLRILAACAEHGIVPTPDLILSAARDPELNIVARGGDERAALLAVLERESTPAGLESYALALLAADRKRRQVARLWRRLRGLIGEEPQSSANLIQRETATKVVKRKAHRPMDRRVVMRG